MRTFNYSSKITKELKICFLAEFKKVVGANREEKSFSRRIHLPEGVMHNTIEASYDEKSEPFFLLKMNDKNIWVNLWFGSLFLANKCN